MLANLDYSVVGNEEVQILECKTAGEYGARLWRYGVPRLRPVSGSISWRLQENKQPMSACYSRGSGR